jgi:hypothetical protein
LEKKVLSEKEEEISMLEASKFGIKILEEKAKKLRDTATQKLDEANKLIPANSSV